MRGRAGALLVLALLAGCAAAPAREQAAGDACPERLGVQGRTVPVPDAPAPGTPGRLVPAEPPRSASVCRYGAEGSLAGEVPLRAGLDRVPADLLLPRAFAGARPACPAGEARPHLLRLRYPAGTVWVSSAQDPGRCVGTTNGPFASPVHTGDLLAASADAGAWTVPDDPDGCGQGRPGRLGQETALVPGEPSQLAVCPVPGGPGRTRAGSPAQLAAVRDLLADPVAAPSTGACAGPDRPATDLLFRYPDGPPVRVRLAQGCRPEVDNGSLQAALEPAQRRRLQQVLAG